MIIIESSNCQAKLSLVGGLGKIKCKRLLWQNLSDEVFLDGNGDCRERR